MTQDHELNMHKCPYCGCAVGESSIENIAIHIEDCLLNFIPNKDLNERRSD